MILISFASVSSDIFFSSVIALSTVFSSSSEACKSASNFSTFSTGIVSRNPFQPA
jgi:ethanolamine utilization microcompartment shell protein EutL